MHQVFQPYTLAGMELQNRIVRSAVNDPFGVAEGTVTDAQIALYRFLAEHDVGLIITGMATVSADGAIRPTQYKLYDDAFIPRHRALAQAVHDAGGKVVAQINHAGAAAMGELPPGPSGIPSPSRKVPSREMTAEEIKAVTADFAAAAGRAQKAGYDGVQLHCAHGYLLSQFLNPYFNKRADRYGGGIENRFRFAREVIEAVKAAVGPDFPVMIKINSNVEEGDEAFGEELLWIGGACRELGVCAVEVSGFDFTPMGRSGRRNYYLERAAALRRASGLPVMLVGGVRSLSDMDAVLDAGIDLVSLGRPFICEPNLVTKMKLGQEEAQCLSCSQCFVLLYRHRPGDSDCILR